MAEYEEPPGGRRAYRQRRGGDPSPSSSNDWTLIEQMDEPLSPHRPAVNAAAAYLHEAQQYSDENDLVGTRWAASSAVQRRQRRRLRQKQQQIREDARDSSDSEPPPSSSTYTPKRAATSSVSMHMRNPPPPPAPSPGLTRSATAPHYRWARSHVYEEDADNSNSRSNSRRSGSRPDRSMAGSRPSSRTSLSDEEDDTDVTFSPPDVKGKSVQSRGRDAVPPPAPPPPRVPAPPTRRGQVVYEEEGEEEEQEDEDIVAIRKRERSRGPVREAVMHEDDRPRRHRRDKSRTPRREKAESVYDDVVDMRRAEERMRSRSRPARAKSVYEEDIELDDDKHIRSKSRARRTDIDLDTDRMKERLRSRSRPRPEEEDYHEDFEGAKQVRAKQSRRDLVYDEDRDMEHARSRSIPRQPEMVYEEDDDSNRRYKSSRGRPAETVYEVDMQELGSIRAPETPNRPRHGEMTYREGSEVTDNPFGERAPSRSRPAPARTERHRNIEKATRRSSTTDDAYSRSQSRSTRLTGRYYESEVAYRGSRAPSLRKSQTTVGSREASSQSLGSSSRRSASLLGQFFGPALQPLGPERPPKLVSCVICMDEVPSTRIARLKCGHRMCNTCLKNVFRKSVKDPELMPPKCCTPDHIPLKHVDKLFDTSFKKTWNRKHAEYTTQNRIYCPSRRCGEWIRPENIRRDADGRKVAQCSQCRTKVCVRCNGKWHKEKHCPRDDDTQAFLQQAKEAGWQRCHRCKAMVELKEGCNHMTCRCGAQFCMICGAKWKSCDCPWFNHDAIESDTLDDMQIPMTLYPEPSLRSVRYPSRPPSPSNFRAHGDDMMIPAARVRSHPFDGQILIRKQLGQQDDIHAPRIRNTDRYDDHDRRYYPEYPGDYQRPREQMTHGGGRGDFLPRPETSVVPPPPYAASLGGQYTPYGTTALGPPGMDYVTGVHRARGMQTGSTERKRLADRFSSDPRHPATRTPTHAQPPPRLNKSSSMPIPPPMPVSLPVPRPMQLGIPPPPIGMMAVRPGHQHHHHHSAPPGINMPPLLRRNTMEDELYSTRSSPRRPKPGMRQHRREEDLDDDDDDQPMASTPPRRHRRRNTHQEGAEASAMAGLSGPGRGMERVFEWAEYVEPGEPVEEKGPLSISTGSTVSVRS